MQFEKKGESRYTRYLKHMVELSEQTFSLLKYLILFNCKSITSEKERKWKALKMLMKFNLLGLLYERLYSIQIAIMNRIDWYYTRPSDVEQR